MWRSLNPAATRLHKNFHRLYFRLCNTVLHHHKKLIFVNLWSENG